MRTFAALLLAAAAAAQNEPHIGYVFPAGLPRGATTEIVVGGRFLQDPSAARFAGTGITAEVREYTRPLTNQERNALRDEAQMLDKARQAGTLDKDGMAKLAAIRKQLQTNPRQVPNPQIAETVVLAVTVAADAPLGERDLRLRTPAGLTNPLHFQVGGYPETREEEPNDQKPDTAAAAVLPIVVNGQILPGDVDRFRVHLLANQHLVATVRARALIPYLADAVPGWFQATLALKDDQGRELAFDDDHLFDPDPELEFDVPIEGDYTLELRDALYRGREDFVYRLEIQALPRESGDAGLRGSTTAAPLGPFPPLTEREPNDSKETAQAVPLPHIVVGRIEKPGDVDVYAIDGHAGQAFVAEVVARRIGSPFDGVLRLVDPQGKDVAVSDDRDDKGSGLVTHQADSYIACKLTMQGTYLLIVRDLQGKGGADYTYRLRLGPPQPDFALRVVPSAVNVRAGTSAVLTVHALRQDGFTGEIALSLQSPDGFMLGGAVVPAGLDKVQVTLTAPPTAPDTPVVLTMEGTATIGNQPVKHAAVPAEDMMQAFAWHHLVAADELLASVQRGGAALGRLTRRDTKPLQLKPGGTAEAVFDLVGARRAMPEGITCWLRDPPAGIAVAETRVVQGSFVVVLKAEKTVKTGLVGNLILEATVERPGAAEAGGKGKGAKQRLGLVLPAVGYAVVKG